MGCLKQTANDRESDPSVRLNFFSQQAGGSARTTSISLPALTRFRLVEKIDVAQNSRCKYPPRI